jgi:FkbM family methyltransferase
LKFKHYFKKLFSGIYLRIQSGPLKGKKWIATSGKKFITGKFETYKSEAFLKEFVPGSIFYDIGAHIGYFSAIACSINKGKGHVYAFEPRPDNAKFFRKHMKVNQFEGFTLTQAAVSANEGEVKFNANTGTATGHISPMGNITVKMISIDQQFESGKLPAPNFIKIDVEGGEIEVLKGCMKVIATCKPKLLVATHSPSTHEFVLNFLNANAYRFDVLNQDGIKGDTEIMAVPSK